MLISWPRASYCSGGVVFEGSEVTWTQNPQDVRPAREAVVAKSLRVPSANLSFGQFGVEPTKASEISPVERET